jgi:hypothetical protein
MQVVVRIFTNRAHYVKGYKKRGRRRRRRKKKQNKRRMKE